MKNVLATFVSAALGGLFCIWLTEPGMRSEADAQVRTGPPDRQSQRADHEPPDPKEAPLPFNRDGLSPEEVINVAVYQRTNKGVVNIITKTAAGFFLLDVDSQGTGSGAVVDKKGHILTNYHVIRDVREVGVTLYDGTSYDATLVGADPRNDIAVIKIDAPKDVLHPIEFGESSALKVGMRVFAIGNPFGLERTMTTGIISSLNRSLQINTQSNWTIKSIIQIDAAINPGNSGGPLIDSHGKVIGINTAIASRTGQSSGVGFAIPISLARRAVPQLIKHGRIIRPEIGIQRVYVTEQGLQIERLTPGGPAENAGLRGPRIIRRRRGPFITERFDRSVADTIIAVDRQEVETGEDLLGYIETKKSGETITLAILRNGRKIDIKVTLAGAEPPPKREPERF